MKHLIPIAIVSLAIVACTANDSPVGPEATPDLAVVEGGETREGFAWSDHAEPFSFLFGNHIDTHQQLRVARREILRGYFYITFSGGYTGEYRDAMHGNCEVLQDDCKVGWRLTGIPVVGTMIEKLPGQHPTWCVEVSPWRIERGFTHFHWLGEPEHAGALEPGDVYDGYLMRLVAVRPFFFKHHGGFEVDRGIDYETHFNVQTGCSAEDEPPHDEIRG